MVRVFFVGIVFIMAFFVKIESFGQCEDCPLTVIGNPIIINECTTQYNMSDNTIVVVFKCDTFWTPPVLDPQLIEFDTVLVVGGGGGGGRRDTDASRGGGGGGAGAAVYITNPTLLQLNGEVIDIKIGAGGTGSTSTSLRGGKGNQSSINSDLFNIIAEGGGGGGSAEIQVNGGAGGSGGGGTTRTGIGGIAANNAYGNRGGNGTGNQNDNVTGGGGGGGAGAQGQDPNGATNGGEGGAGKVFGITNGLPPIINNPNPLRPIDAPNNIFAGGGGGVGGNPGGQGRAELGGSFIGGNGINTSGLPGLAGLVNTGSGGGAGFSRGGNGSSGIVIIKYSIPVPTPVIFKYVNGIYENKNRSSIIKWSTSKEWENSHFEIERSIDGTKTFVKIGQVSGMGWTEEVTEYLFEDDKLPLSGGNIYYRLKQVDFNGRFDYSDITTVRVPNIHITKGVWRVYPNPSESNGFNLELVDIGQYHDESISLRILSSHILSTEKVFRNIHELNQTASDFLSTVPKGLWIVEVKWGNRVERIKVMKR